MEKKESKEMIGWDRVAYTVSQFRFSLLHLLQLHQSRQKDVTGWRQGRGQLLPTFIIMSDQTF